MISQSNNIPIRRIMGKQLQVDSIETYLPRGQANLGSTLESVNSIIQTVKTQGDQALIEYTLKFDGIDLSKSGIEVEKEAITAAYSKIKPELVTALKTAKDHIESFHKAQFREVWFIETTPGVKTGQMMRPLRSAGLYVPGGLAVYPSSVLMEAVPAKVAGVEKLVLCSPPQKDGEIAPAILVAADICGVDHIYRLGGAQAVAAMAYGTQTVAKIQKIVGPGNKWVAAAKQAVSTVCGIDNPAGPSEILLVADSSTNPQWAAYDLLAQCEHGPDNVSVLLSEDQSVIDQILQELEKIVAASPRKHIVEANLKEYGLIVKSENHEETVRLINLIATEHLHLCFDGAESWLSLIQNAGAVFLGQTSPVPLGDYCAGTNHVLPTAGYAQIYSGLSTFDFVKIMDILNCSPEGLKTLFPTLEPIAEFEGLYGHRDCVKSRLAPRE